MRAIDADALKEQIRKGLGIKSFKYLLPAEKYIVEKIDRMPTVQPEPQWTPCSEGLPKAKQKVMVQYADGSMATKRCNDAGHLQWFYANAVAWIPAPEPYQPKGEL